MEKKIDMLDEINNSYLDEYDKHEPRLLLCTYCTRDYQITGYPFQFRNSDIASDISGQVVETKNLVPYPG